MLSFRSITKDLVEECIEHPDEILPARERKTIYLKGFGKKFLKVIGSRVGVDIVVVTFIAFSYILALGRDQKNTTLLN